MQEFDRDAYSNQCMSEATKLVNEAKILLKENKLKEAILNDYNAIIKSMNGVLAIDDIFPENEISTDKNFRSLYIDNGRTSEELHTTLDKIQEYIDTMSTNPEHKIGKPDAGYFTSKANFFVLEITDYIVERNALFWGQ